MLNSRVQEDQVHFQGAKKGPFFDGPAKKKPCTSRTVRNVLSCNPRAKFVKLQPQPPLTKNHKLARLEFAKKYISLGDKWKDIIFSDEKKFNFDGPDGFKKYWHDIKKIKPYFSKRHYDGGSVMVWGAFAANGTLPIVIIETKMNSEKYQDMLGDTLLPNAPLVTSGDWTFQQDNASIHAAQSTKAWFEANEVRLLNWPSRSPDLNPIENVWGMITQSVYKDMRQYRGKGELVNAIRNSWENIKTETLSRLAATMSDRLIKVIKEMGEFVGY